MIHFVLHEHHRYAVANFIDAWGRDVRPRIRIHTYQDLRYARHLPRGTYVFGDVDRLTRAERNLGSCIADTLLAAGCRVLNHPEKVCWRRELARRLEGAGLNGFRCFRADEDWSGVRYPAFVRREDDHGGLKRELLHDADAVRAAIKAIGGPPSETLIVEYIDTRDANGIFRKYSALRVGGRPFPRHLLFSRDWIVKYADLVDEPLLAEELRYLDDYGGDMGHADQVARAFELANVEYGRIDYSLAPDGKIQVWEINLSPNLGSPPNKIALGRLVSQWHVSAAIVAAIGALDDGTPADAKPIVFNCEPDLRMSAGARRRDAWLAYAGKAIHRIERLPIVRPLRDTYRRARWLASR